MMTPQPRPKESSHSMDASDREDRPGSPLVTRFVGRCGLAIRRFKVRATVQAPWRTWTAIVGVALSVAILLVVTGLALGIAGPAGGTGDGQTYWIVPESSNDGSLLVSSSSTRFGVAHESIELIERIDGVRYATPVLVEIMPVESPDGTREHVAVIGIVPQDGASVFGLSTEGLTPGTPFYADGQYDGEWTGDAVVSLGAAELTGASEGTSLAPVSAEGDREFTIRRIDRSGSSGIFRTFPSSSYSLRSYSRSRVLPNSTTRIDSWSRPSPEPRNQLSEACMSSQRW
ncbi:MAG: hypothetical protein U5K37_05145 [Natrialbaceae archaeon]|nr:hypothetical protein [Natrialbaceae archaeon]